MTSDNENKNPWVLYNALAERIHEALAGDGTKRRPTL
jgi:hypothetical protein